MNDGSSRSGSKSVSSFATSRRLGRRFERLAKVIDRVVGAAGLRLAAGEVVERRGVASRLERAATPLDHALVVAGLIRGMELGPHLPAAGLVGLSHPAADREHRRLGVDGERRPVSFPARRR